ncbi:MAG: glycosyltransferase family 9 protein [Calditrichota bacterium]
MIRIPALERPGARILVIQTAFLGDVILATPLFRVLRKYLPQAEVHVLVLPSNAEVISSQVAKVITIDKRERRGLGERWKQLTRELKRNEYALALIPHRSGRSALTARRAGIPYRIGFARGWGRFWHTSRIPYESNLYEGQRNLKLLRSFLEFEDDGLPQLFPTEYDNGVVQKILDDSKLENYQFIVMAPGSVWATKRWPEEYYQILTKRIYQEAGLPTVWVGGKEDYELGERLSQTGGINLIGRFTPLQSAALMALSRLVISGDSAPAHLASAMRVRQLIIFGSTTPQFGFAPPVESARGVGVDLWCRPCNNHGRRRCPWSKKPACLYQVTPEYVFRSIEDWL